MDKYYGNVCELDIIFNFQKAYFILDELLLAGELQESSKKNVLRCISQQDSLEDMEVSDDLPFHLAHFPFQASWQLDFVSVVVRLIRGIHDGPGRGRDYENHVNKLSHSFTPPSVPSDTCPKRVASGSFFNQEHAGSPQYLYYHDQGRIDWSQKIKLITVSLQDVSTRLEESGLVPRDSMFK